MATTKKTAAGKAKTKKPTAKSKAPVRSRQHKPGTVKAKATEKPVAKKNKPKTKPSKPVEKSNRTIRAAALELLCHITHYEDKKQKSGPDNVVLKAGVLPKTVERSVGLPYDEIIRRLQDEFPDAQTTVACLRWYSVKARVEEFGYEGYKLPGRRPRAKPGAAS
jgi:hypothetical protein